MIVLNAKKLAITPVRKDALKIIESGYEAINIEKLTKRRFKVKGSYLEVCDLACKEKVNLNDFERIFVIGFGKGSCAAVSVMADVLGKRLFGAISLDVETSFKPKKINKNVTVYWGTHPMPSKINVEATSIIISIAKDAGEKDLVIYFIGGGGSSLLCGSLGELKYASWLFKEMTRKGATIDEINVVRKHVSEVKGGNLAKFTYPATSLSLVVSDVCGNPLDTIASGPTVYDKTTVEDAIKILQKYKVSLKKNSFVETPKDKHYFDRCKYFLLACNEDAAIAMLATARRLGYSASIGSLLVRGEARDVIFPFFKKVKAGQIMALAGETTVTIKGKGKGGRNQELALSVLDKASRKKINLSKVFVASFASDGFDNTPVAGAIADEVSLEKIKKLKLNPSKYLLNNDSYAFFQKTGDFVCVERKSFNVADLMLIIRK
jgi:glycerate-2-kinase